MITINADSLLASIETLKLKGLEMRAAARDDYRSQILEMYYQLLLISPQYSSDFVSNWDLVVEGANEHSYSRSSEKEEFVSSRGEHKAPHEAGELSAGLRSAYARGRAKVANIKYFGQPVYFVNSTPLEIDTPDIIASDGGVQELRDGAVVFAWVSITSYLQSRFGS